MSEYGGVASLVELIFSFGVALGFVGWQIIVTRRGIRKDREEAEAARLAAAAHGASGEARSSKDASP